MLVPCCVLRLWLRLSGLRPWPRLAATAAGTQRPAAAARQRPAPLLLRRRRRKRQRSGLRLRLWLAAGDSSIDPCIDRLAPAAAGAIAAALLPSLRLLLLPRCARCAAAAAVADAAAGCRHACRLELERCATRVRR